MSLLYSQFNQLYGRKKFWYGFTLWFLLFFGYMMFCVNWMIMSWLEGSVTTQKGWAYVFDIAASSSSGENSNRKILDAINYCIPLARGIAAIPIAWFVMKLGHKHTVIMALFLTSAALPLVFAPTFTWFIVGRMTMSVGGTMLIILLQPIISNFFNLKWKGYLSIASTWAYIWGALGVHLLFLNTSLSEFLVSHWQTIAALSACLTLLPAFGYLFVGIKIPCNIAGSNDKKEEVSYGQVLKEKDCWFWIFFYSCLLVVSVLVSQFVPKIISKLNPGILSTVTTVGWEPLYTVIFYCGAFFGFIVGLWNKTKARRKPFVVVCCGISTACWVVILGSILCTTLTPFMASSLIYSSIFILSFFGIGIQSVLLYIPHEYPNNSTKRLTIFYSYLWGIGYILFAFYYFGATYLFDQNPYYALWYITIFMILFIGLACCIKESRPYWPLVPWKKEDKFGNKIMDIQIQPITRRYSRYRIN